MLQKMLERLIRVGRLTVIGPDGRRMNFGAVLAGVPDLDVVVRLKGRLTPVKLALAPDFYLGEAYMDGLLTIERGTLWDLLDICGRNLSRGWWARQGWHVKFVRRHGMSPTVDREFISDTRRSANDRKD